MKNLRQYLANGLPAPRNDEVMKHRKKRVPYTPGERANRKVLRQKKRSMS